MTVDIFRSPSAHPRSRGENNRDALRRKFQPGSSPLTRGKPGRRRVSRRGRRLIPAHAGKTPARGLPSQTRAAHPRSRGENRMSAPATCSRAGSSPLTRGKLVHAEHLPAGVRLIPAHAGKTGCPESRSICSRAHPRSRGENSGMVVVPMVTSGSSPLTRGKPIRCQPQVQKVRLIPAHAGKTSSTSTHSPA